MQSHNCVELEKNAFQGMNLIFILRFVPRQRGGPRHISRIFSSIGFLVENLS